MAYSGTYSGAILAERPPRAATAGGSNIDSPTLAALFAVCAAAYLGIYATEAPIRYGLYLAGKDSLILARDALMLGPLLLLAAAQAMRLQLHGAFMLWGVLMAFHGLVLVGTVGSVAGAAYGAKVLINLLFGFFAAGLLVTPDRPMARALALIWLVIVVGVWLDKFVLTFPWTGIKTVIGDLNVDVSKDWQIQDPLARRVAGFTRSSIAVAAVLPCLTIALLSRLRHPVLRGMLALVAAASLFLTTQKGSIIAFLPVAAILCLSPQRRAPRLRLCFAAFVAAAVALPLLTLGLHMAHGDGVFSTESLYLRIADTWPDAWRWIVGHQMLLFGVGLGGIGGPQRLYAPDSFNPSDNIAVLLYAYFGVFAILYVGLVCVLAFRPAAAGRGERIVPALAILAFAFGYGTVLSVIEDQSASLFLGAAVGVLWRETRRYASPEAP